jgi:poly(3-hydroxybutyrate) depolymerase
VEHNAVETELARWAALAGCAAGGSVVEQRRGAAGGAEAGQTAVLLDFAPCASGGDVRLWKLTGAGHGWPGAPPVLGESVMGPETHVILAAEEVWRFVRGFSRPEGPPL